MKKVIKNIMLLIMFLTLFVWKSALANTTKETIEIENVFQDGKEQELVDGTYKITKTSYIEIKYTIKNAKEKTSYMIEEKNENGSSSSFGVSSYELSNTFTSCVSGFSLNSKYSKTTVNLYDATTKELLDSKTINLENTLHEKYNLSNAKLYLEKIVQGGKEVIPDESFMQSYHINKKQDVLFYLKGTGFVNDSLYPVGNSMNGNYEYISGEMLNDGLVLNVPLKNLEYYYGFTPIIKFDFLKKPLNVIRRCEGYCPFNIEFTDVDNITDYDISLGYTNYTNELIKSLKDYNENFQNIYIVSKQFHNINDSLYLNIKGKNYLDKDYEVSFSILKDNKVLYNDTITVNGLKLNEGYKMIFADFVSDEIKTMDEEKDMFNVMTNIDYITSKLKYMYSHSSKYQTINSEIFFENGKKNLSIFKGDGGLYFNAGFAETNNNVFQKYSKIYLRYLGNNFENNLTYDYKFSYGPSNNKAEFNNFKELDSGKISGKILNERGLMYAVANEENYAMPTYRLEVSYNGEIIYFSSPIIELVDYPTFANVSLTNTNNKDLYLKMDDYSYIATRNFPMKLAISGVGFVDEEEYEINFDMSFFYKDQNVENSPAVYTFKGKDLNDGTAYINISKKITSDIISASFYAYIDNEVGPVQGGFDVTFVDSKDFFKENKNYSIDNANDLIKDIKGKTYIKDFTENLKLNDNSKIKIFDKTGKYEEKDYIGTGMIARISDVNDNALVDLDIVVKGDVSGDGNISITDLVNIKRHLAQIKKLDGVYEMAGMLTNEEDIGITDLVKVGQSIANDEVIE